MAGIRPVVIAVVPFVAGVIAAPHVKPMFRSALRASVGAGLRLRVLAEEAAADYQDLAAEARADANERLGDA